MQEVAVPHLLSPPAGDLLMRREWLRLLAMTAVRQRSRHRLYRFRFRHAPAGALRVHITPRRSPHAGAAVTLRARTSDRRVFEQIFLNDEYDLRSLARWPELETAARAEPAPLILDLGANIGLASLALHFQLPTARILAVEPDPANFAQLQRNTAAIAAITPLHAAVAAHDGWVRIANPGAATAGLRTETAARGGRAVCTVGKVGARRPRNSRSGGPPPGDEAARPRPGWATGPSPAERKAGGVAQTRQAPRQSMPGAHPIPARSIATLCAGASPLIVKMDIEGAERDLFTDPAWLDAVRLLIVEPHDWAFPRQALSQPLLAALAARAGDVLVRGEHLFAWSPSI